MQESATPVVGGRVRPLATGSVGSSDQVRRYILTSAQNNTHVYQDAWDSLLALADYYGAEVLVSRFTYDKSAYGKKSVKPGSGRLGDYDDLWYDPQLAPYVNDSRVELAPGLIWCGELNILPTAVDPLSGLEAYTGRASAIVPHAKFAMTSVASGRSEPTKFNYTTGTVTQRNYIQKKAGLRAEHEHGYGGLLAEVDPDGSWWVRQLQVRPDGSIQDLDVVALPGSVSAGHRVEAVTWGDVHERQVDPTVAALNWAHGGILDALSPRYQFIHDVLDFRARNHHELKNPHLMFERFARREDSVERELERVHSFLAKASRDWCATLVVDSNHDQALTRWLAEADYRRDPLNAVFFLEANLALYRALEEGRRDFHVAEWAVQRLGALPGVRFLREDESFVVCRDSSGGIECGMHGHRGPNGARPGIKQFAKMGRRANVAHSHTAGIYGGVYQAGTSSLLDLGYNRGPSSWSHSHVVTYPGGTRAVVTIWDGRWRASRS